MKSGSHHGYAVRLGIAAAAIALAIPVSASAQRGVGGGGGFFNNPGMRLWTALDQRFEDVTTELSLTEAQTDSVTTLVTNFREANKDVLGRWKNTANSMRSRTRGAGGGGARGAGGGGARGAGGGGARGAGGGMQEIRNLLEQLGPALETLHSEVTKLLDEEQVKTLATILERRPPRG